MQQSQIIVVLNGKLKEAERIKKNEMPKLVFKAVVEYELDFSESVYNDIPEVTNYHSAVNWELAHNRERIEECLREMGIIKNIEGFVK